MSRFNEKRLRELLLYVLERREDDCLGDAKLNKMLFSADFTAYARLGRPITGASYLALDCRPVAKQFDYVVETMRADGSLARCRRGRQSCLVALRDPDLSIFAADEIAIVHRILFQSTILAEIAESEPHEGFLGWKAARAESASTGQNVEIPYETVFVESRPLDEYEQEHGRELARRHGWPI